jgi:iron complex outermembrane recepter protein
MAKSAFLGTAAFLALVSTPALAQAPGNQDAPADGQMGTTSPAPAASPEPDQTATAEAEQARSEGDIVVTGLKRDQAFVDVPVAVQVFNEELITQAGIQRPQDFLQLTPNVTFQSSNHAGEFFVNIRGQTSVRQSEGAVAFVIDGVQLATQNEFNGELFDIQQIEVLKGPQSAIYGRLASAGAIIITTKEPTDTFEGQVFASYGNWQSARANASVSGPIIPGKLRFRASVAMNDTDGPFTNINTGEKVMRANEKLARLRFIWDPTEDTRVDLRFNGSRLRGGAIAFNAQVVGATQGGVTTTQIDTNDTSLPYTADVPGLNRQNKLSTSLKIDHDFGVATLTSVTSYNRIVDNYQAKNYPYGAFNFAGNEFVSDALSPGLNLDILAAFGDNTQKFRIRNNAFVQELRLTSPGDQRFRWQVGAFFLKSERNFTTEQGLNGRLPRDAAGAFIPPFTIAGTNIGAPVAPVQRNIIGGGSILPTLGIDGPDTNNPTLNYDRNNYRTTNYAVFGNVQYDLTDQFEVQLALRYDNEKRRIRTQTPNIPNPFFGVAPGAPAATYNLCVATTGRTADDCRESRTFSQVQPKASVIYKFPNDSGSIFANYGKGFKSGGFNPIGTRATLLVGLPNILVQDSYDKETADSFEVGFKSQLFNDRVALNGSVFYTRARNTQQFEFFPTGGIQAISQIKRARIWGAEADIQIRPTDTLTIFGGFGYIDTKITDIDSQDPADRAAIIGNKIPFAAEYNGTAGFQLTQPIGGDFELVARGEYNRTGRIFYDQRNSPNTSRDPVDIVNARLGIQTDRFEISLWSRNLFDENYNSDAVVILPVAHAVFRAPPRSYGIEGRVRF